MSYTRRRIMQYRGMYLFLIPALVTTFLFRYRPMFGLVMAFQDFSIETGYFSSPFVGLKHFVTFFTNPEFYRSLRNTLGISTLSLVFNFPVPIAFALLLNELKWMKFKRVSQTVSYLPHFISWIVVSTMVVRILDVNLGIVNNVIALLGGTRVPFMREPRYFWQVVIVAYIWKGMGWNSIIYLAALSGVDQEMYEAAMIDGANRLKTLLYITLPAIAPTIALLFVLDVGNLINASGSGLFDAVYNLQNPLVAERAYIIEMYAYYEGIIYRRYSYAAAVTLLQAVVSLSLVLGANGIYKKVTGNSVY